MKSIAMRKTGLSLLYPALWLLKQLAEMPCKWRMTPLNLKKSMVISILSAGPWKANQLQRQGLTIKMYFGRQ